MENAQENIEELQTMGIQNKDIRQLLIGKEIYRKLSGFATNTKQTSIANAKLSELDRIREDILKSGSTQFEINSQTNSYFQKTLGKTNEKINLKNPCCGLLLKTYQSDIFNNWIKTEWISGQNGISAITAISTAGDKFTIDQLNLSKKVYDMLNRIAVSGDPIVTGKQIGRAHV